MVSHTNNAHTAVHIDTHRDSYLSVACDSQVEQEGARRTGEGPPEVRVADESVTRGWRRRRAFEGQHKEKKDGRSVCFDRRW